MSTMEPSLGLEKTHAVSSQPHLDRFHQLVADLSGILGPSSGLNSEDVNVQEYQLLMENYVSNQEDWKQYAFSDSSRGYTRNLVDEGNGESNLLVLVWTPGKGSSVHDHAGAHCLMKILKGSLVETRYDFPQDPVTPPKIIKETVYKQDQVTYMSDELGVHKISNPDPAHVAVSLHLYTPPNAAKLGVRIFNEKTGKSQHITQSNFFSVYGKKI